MVHFLYMYFCSFNLFKSTFPFTTISIIIYLQIVTPQILPFDFGEESVNKDETVSAQCTISKGDSPLNITWSLNGKNIAIYDGIAVINRKRASFLTIDSVQAEHAGTYSCIATNLAGTANHSAELNVNGTKLINFK